jgi:SAM-dependent methyltransferase
MAQTLPATKHVDRRSAALAQFGREYRAVRRAEGWGSAHAGYYRALPYRDLTGRNEWIWRIRLRSFETFVERVLRPVEDRHAGPLSVLDLGAGNGWLAYRLAQRAHRVIAVDLFSDAFDGLGAVRHYEVRFSPVQAEFDHLPLRNAVADLAVFNAALHYSTDCAGTLREALRVLRPAGSIVILDTPFYATPAAGSRMVQEREARFVRDFGFASDTLAAEHFMTPARLDQLAQEVGLRWRVLEPPSTWRGALGRRYSRLRLGREPARFPVIIGTRA